MPELVDIFTFIVGLVEALAWPTVAVVITILLRRPLLRAFDERRLKRLKAGTGGIEAEFFEDRLDAARNRLPQLQDALPVESAPQLGPAPKQKEEPIDDDMLDHAPAGAMLASWRLLEKSLSDAIREIDEETLVLHSGNARRQAEYLAKDGLLSPAVAEIVRSLQDVRNRVVHPSEADTVPTVEQARDFVATVEFVRRTIEETAKQLSARPLEGLLAQLKITDAHEVQVAPMRGGGVGATLAVAREVARWREGRFVARAGGVTMMLNRVEASRLLNAGAVYREQERDFTE